MGFTLLLGCTAAADNDAGDGRTQRTASSKPSNTALSAPPRAYDPVTRFSAQELHFPGDLSRARLDGTTAWITGESTVIRPKGKEPGISPLFGRPVLTEPDGKRVALALLPVSTPGSGTYTDQDAIEMLVVDARTGKDRTGRLPDVPDLVNAYVGLFQKDDDNYEGEPPTTVRRTEG